MSGGTLADPTIEVTLSDRGHTADGAAAGS